MHAFGTCDFTTRIAVLGIFDLPLEIQGQGQKDLRLILGALSLLDRFFNPKQNNHCVGCHSLLFFTLISTINWPGEISDAKFYLKVQCSINHTNYLIQLSKI